MHVGCMFVAFSYISTNPFIYATKFDAVRKVLIALIPCKKSPIQPASGTANAGTHATSMPTGQGHI